MKTNKLAQALGGFLFSFREGSFRPGPTYAVVSVLFVALGAAFFGPTLGGGAGGDASDFEVGRVADRDVVAERTVIYVDEEATRLRRVAQERLVPASFRISASVSKKALAAFAAFASFSRERFAEKSSADAYALAAEAEYPGFFSKETLAALHRSASRTQLLDAAESALRMIMDAGVFSFPSSGLDGFNPDLIEIVRTASGRNERERVSSSSLATLANLDKRIAAVVSDGSFPKALVPLAAGLFKPFVAENAFYSAEDSALRLDEARSRVQPVVKRIERGDKVIRKGFIVSKDDLDRYKALGSAPLKRSASKAAGTSVLLLLVFAIAIASFSDRVVKRRLKDAEIYMLAAFAAAYVLGAAFSSELSFIPEHFPVSVFLPTALLTMLLSALMGTRVALAFAFVLPTAAFVSGFFDSSAFIFDVVSGVVGAFVLQGSERRMDLIRAGAVLAAVQSVAAAGVLLAGGAGTEEFVPTLFWAAFNGFVCGMTILGFLPMFEHWLDAITPFRLIELSDLNSPMLKRLLTTAPGTYSHSVTVANLAESACREIGANALLARVGAYYHDIGKMDQPEYFIENQAAYNKHDDIQPRLSATVIRSHVKLGIEKARQLGLPKEVVDIISEHHGNSVISWFYNEALKREDQVNADDFSYPGVPPKSRESAVVMLADSVEAAVRTLKKPTLTKLDKFVQELIMTKFEQDQLSDSELTFKDLETIKNAFVRVLAGHYHSRIEYPKSKETVR